MPNLAPVRRYLHHQLCHARLRSRWSPRRIARFRDLHRGETLFCIGAGPSLRNERLELLDGRVLIFVNRSFELLKSVAPARSYWFVQDAKALVSYREVDRNLFDASFCSVHDYSYSPWRLPFQHQDILILPRFSYSRAGWPLIQEPGPNFSDDLTDHVGMTPTVIFSAVQLAAFMGASRIVLLGMDLQYGEDAQHFYTDETAVKLKFFGPYESTLKPVLQAYHQHLNANCERLVNCSSTSRDDVLPRRRLEDVA
jgi:hypothetical protein